VETSVELNAYADSQLPDLAGWLLHLGTIDEARYPSVSLNLAHPTFTADDAMMTAALVLDIGDKVTIDNPPAWLPPDQIGLIVEGYTETLNGLEHTLVLNCSPESVHHIAVYDDTSWRYESDGSTLTSDVSEAATSLSVTIPSGPVWSHTDGDFDITIGGERMTVTGIAGATSTSRCSRPLGRGQSRPTPSLYGHVSSAEAVARAAARHPCRTGRLRERWRWRWLRREVVRRSRAKRNPGSRSRRRWRRWQVRHPRCWRHGWHLIVQHDQCHGWCGWPDRGCDWHEQQHGRWHWWHR
jgi:hypothetical protein